MVPVNVFLLTLPLLDTNQCFASRTVAGCAFSRQLALSPAALAKRLDRTHTAYSAALARWPHASVVEQAVRSLDRRLSALGDIDGPAAAAAAAAAASVRGGDGDRLHLKRAPLVPPSA